MSLSEQDQASLAGSALESFGVRVNKDGLRQLILFFAVVAAFGSLINVYIWAKSDEHNGAIFFTRKEHDHELQLAAQQKIIDGSNAEIEKLKSEQFSEKLRIERERIFRDEIASEFKKLNERFDAVERKMK